MDDSALWVTSFKNSKIQHRKRKPENPKMFMEELLCNSRLLLSRFSRGRQVVAWVMVAEGKDGQAG